MILHKLNPEKEIETSILLFFSFIIGCIQLLPLMLLDSLFHAFATILSTNLMAFLLLFTVSKDIKLNLVCFLTMFLVPILFSFTKIFPFVTGLKPILILIGIIIFLTEIIFWLSPKEDVKPKKIFRHTIKRKIEAFFESILVLVAATELYLIGKGIRRLLPELSRIFAYLGKGLVAVAAVVIALAVLVWIGYVFIKLNSMKYEK